MYITPLKTVLIEALKLTFDSQYPVAEFQGVRVGMEYPVDTQQYPSIWVDYDDTQALVKAGIRHEETVNPEDNTTVAPFTRFRFQGYISLTVVALTSLERDRLFDEIVNVVAFSLEDTPRGRFAAYIASNDLVAANLQTDRIQPRGSQAAPGTPWSTDELIYERSLNIEVIGEFYPDMTTGTLVPLSKIIAIPVQDISGESTPEGKPVLAASFGEWH